MKNTKEYQKGYFEFIESNKFGENAMEPIEYLVRVKIPKMYNLKKRNNEHK